MLQQLHERDHVGLVLRRQHEEAAGHDHEEPQRCARVDYSMTGTVLKMS